MDGYDAKSCNALEKPFYRPVEAALRWCGLIEHEAEILRVLNGAINVPQVGQFPRWPCLRANTEKIIDAAMHGNIPNGWNGEAVANGERVRSDKLTVRHSDLREWMAKYYPDQKPAFLFDEIERKTHAAFNADSFRVLQADRDAARAQLEQARNLANETLQKMSALQGERDSLAAMVEKMNVPGARAETTYLNIIGGLLGLMLGKSPAGKPQSVFENQEAVISALLAHYGDKPGVSESTLENKFAEAKRSIKAG